jgi:4-amino-4-deoxy-L-arabinose transferase-like glycosyltransferase
LEGSLQHPGLALAELVAALAIAFIGLARGWGKAAGWLALGLIGQAALLELYQAGPVVGYAHLRFWHGWSEHALPLVVLAAQVGVVAVAAAPRLRRWGSWIGGRIGSLRAGFVLALMLAASAKLARPVEDFATELGVVFALHLVQLATIVLAVQALPPAAVERLRELGARWLGAPGEGPEPGGLDRFAWTAALWCFLGTALLAVFVYERHPHVPDEVSYLLGARIFAHGGLSAPAPPVPEAFDVDLMTYDGQRWFSPVNPGCLLPLAVGARLGAPWLVNPVLSGLCVLAIYLFVREIADRRTARVSLLLACASPWFLFLGMSFMPHTWTLLCAVLAALAVARARRTGASAWAWFAGAMVGLVSLIRPLDGLAVGALLGLWALGLGGARLRLGSIAGLGLGALLVGAAVLPYNRHLTGRATRHPIMDYVDRVYGPGRNDLGFGPEKGLDWGGLDPWPGHTPQEALVNVQFNLAALDLELFGWATGSLWLLALAAFARRRERAERLMLAVLAAVVGLSCLYWFSGGPDFGPRYWFLAFAPCLVLTASGLRRLEAAAGGESVRAGAAVLALAFLALATFVPWRAIDKYRSYRGMEPGVRELAQEHGFGRSLVLVRGARHPDYASAAAYNPLDWDAGEPIYAWDRNAEARAKVLERYADRPIWIVAGPSVTGGGFRLVEGPLSAAEVLAGERGGSQ